MDGSKLVKLSYHVALGIFAAIVLGVVLTAMGGPARADNAPTDKKEVKVQAPRGIKQKDWNLLAK